MASRSKIEWTDATWNPIDGCWIVSAGCTNCYAMRQAHRLATMPKTASRYGMLTRMVNGNPIWTGEVRPAPLQTITQPIRWKKPRRIFVNSMSDLFHEAVNDTVLEAIFAIMETCHWHIFQILTKRPERMQAFIQRRVDLDRYAVAPNVWLGVSIEDQRSAEARLRPLIQTPAAIRWLSAEPLLGPITLPHTGIDWVVVGGESGPNARPMHPNWPRGLRDQCLKAGTPFTFKQWGEHISIDQPSAPAEVRAKQLSSPWGRLSPMVARIGKKAAGRLLDGQLWDEQPTLASEPRHAG